MNLHDAKCIHTFWAEWNLILALTAEALMTWKDVHMILFNKKHQDVKQNQELCLYEFLRTAVTESHKRGGIVSWSGHWALRSRCHGCTASEGRGEGTPQLRLVLSFLAVPWLEATMLLQVLP